MGVDALRGKEKNLQMQHFLHSLHIATSFKTSVLSCWVNHSVVVTWRAWTCAAAAAQSLWRTASAPSRWGCSPAAQSKACGPRRPSSNSRREWRVPPHREPGLTQNYFNNLRRIHMCERTTICSPNADWHSALMTAIQQLRHMTFLFHLLTPLAKLVNLPFWEVSPISGDHALVGWRAHLRRGLGDYVAEGKLTLLSVNSTRRNQWDEMLTLMCLFFFRMRSLRVR